MANVLAGALLTMLTVLRAQAEADGIGRRSTRGGDRHVEVLAVAVPDRHVDG